MKGNVIVTGGAGFIGSHVVDRLLDEGFSVAVVDNLSTGKKENLNPGARFYSADICDSEEMAGIFSREKPRFVNHHAAQIDVRKSVDDPVFDARSNILGSINLLEESRKSGIEKFIYISTGGAVYGEPDALPAREDFPVKPISAYGVSKHTAEHYLELYSLIYGLEYTVLRYANVYGPRQDPGGEAGVIALFTGMMFEGKNPVIFGDGEQTRDYVYVGDVAEANMLALGRGGGGIYNVGTGEETSVNAIFSAIAGLTGFNGSPVYAPPRRGEVGRISLDNSRALEDLGWRPLHGLGEGLGKTVSYHRKTRGEAP